MTEPKNTSRFFLPSIGDFLFLALFVPLSLYSGKCLLYDGDTGYHIRAGEYILDTLSIPRYDMFSYLSPPLHWTAHEWLSEIIMAVIHINFGLTGVVIFFAFLISLATRFLFKIIYSDTNNIITAVFITLFATAASRMHWLARPHIFSLVLMIIWYYLLDSRQYNGKYSFYYFPIIMIVWVNLHAGFMGGFLLLGIYLLGNLIEAFFVKAREKEAHLKKSRGLASTTFACLAVSLINPYGYHILLFPFKLTSANDLIDYVSEFASPNFHADYAKAFGFYLLFILGTVGFSKSRLNVIESLSVSFFTCMSLYSARYIPLFAIVSAPVLARQLQTIEEQSGGKFASFMKKRAGAIAASDASSIGCFWTLASLALVIALAATGAVKYEFDEKMKPVAAVNFLKKEHIPGHMFNNDEFGDYIIYSAYPLYKVFIDGRLDMYGVNNVKQYLKIINFERGWDEIVTKYDISWIIFGADSALSRFLLIHKEWKLIYADKVANVFVKNLPANRYLIDKYRTVKPAMLEEKEDAAR